MVQRQARAAGHDGLVVRNKGGFSSGVGGDQIVVFDTTNVVIIDKP